MLELIKKCPVCSAEKFSVFLEGKDYFLSGENFSIQMCGSCGFKFTNPRPNLDNVLKYYESEKYISHQAVKTDLVTRIYKAARFFAIRQKYSIIISFSKGTRYLDIGCGTAELLRYCAKRGLTVKGIEPNEKPRNFAQMNYSLEVEGDLTAVKGKGESFNCISFWHVLEHLPSLSQSLNDIKSILEPQGVVIIAVPNAASWDAGYYQKFWAAYDLPRHLYHFSEETLKKLIESHGFEIVAMKPQKLDAFYISLLSEEYKTGKRNYCKALFNGLRSNLMAKRKSCGYSSLIIIIKRKNP